MAKTQLPATADAGPIEESQRSSEISFAPHHNSTSENPPASLSPVSSAGNQAVQRLFRSDWNTGAPADRQEQEARHTASQVDAESQGPLPGAEPVRQGETPTVGGPLSPVLGPGHALDPATRRFFESRLGTDLRSVRLHSNSASHAVARALRARAFAAANDIGFASGQYEPHTTSGKQLLTHELVHVVQQRQGRDASSRPDTGPVIQRSPDDEAGAEPEPQQVTPETATAWRSRVDAAVRSYFGLSGPGLTAARVHFVSEAQFAGRIPSATIPELLLDLFLSPPSGSRIHDILRHNHMAFAGPARLRQFIADRMQAGYFEYSYFRPLEGRVVQRITPRELIAETVGGVTDIHGPRAARRVVIPMSANVETLVHEACHLYVHSSFRDFANSSQHRDQSIFGFRRAYLLNEGFAEYFARQVMEANREVFGPMTIRAYQPAVEVIWRLVVTMTEESAREAYFQGSASALQRLEQAIALNRQTNPELLVPSFMIP